MQAVMNDGFVGPVEPFDEKAMMEYLDNSTVSEVKVFLDKSAAYEDSKKLFANMSRKDRKRIKGNLKTENNLKQ